MDQTVQERVIEHRLSLHQELIEILGTQNEAKSRVYYQPPESIKMEYPAIVYRKDGGRIFRANNKAYLGKQQYQVMVIDSDPDSAICHQILTHFMLCEYDRSYTADNLYHDVLTLYY